MARRSFYSQIGITKKDLNEMASFLAILILIVPITIHLIFKVLEWFCLFICFIIETLYKLYKKISSSIEKRKRDNIDTNQNLAVLTTNSLDNAVYCPPSLQQDVINKNSDIVDKQNQIIEKQYDPNVELREWYERKQRENEYLLTIFPLNRNSENNYFQWFINYQPLYIKNKPTTIKKVNEEYEKKLFVDSHYEFNINPHTCHQKFPKCFIKFEKGYKRYGAISFYGVTKSWFQDYLFYSRSAGDFILEKIHFACAYTYNQNNNSFSRIKYTSERALKYNDIDDIYIFTKSELTKQKLLYESVYFSYLDVYKNKRLIKRISIANSRVNFESETFTITNNVDNTKIVYMVSDFKELDTD